MTFLGASAVALGILSSGAQARTVFYEINGKKFSYSTNNRAQAAEARKRIQAAKAAEAAKAKADAEKAKYPLLAAFGSKTQKEATEAQEKLKQVLSDDGKAVADVEATRPSKHSEDRSSKRRGDAAKEAPAVKESRKTAALVQEPVIPAPTSPAKVSAMIVPAVAEPVTIQNRSKKVKSVSFDVESGIKTTIMVDGSVEEEPFDSSALSQLAPEHNDANSLTAFVKQLRRTSPEETTGSIPSKIAQPEPEALN